MTPSELASPDGTHSGRTPSRIVVIDDEQDMRASISQWLSLSGFQPETYASAEEALANLGADFPGIVVTDIRMPGMDGMVLLKKLMGMDATLPVILITGHGDVPMAVRALKAGAIEFLLKPFREQDLLDAVRKAIDTDIARRRSEAALAGLRARFVSLSAREKEVMALVVQGRLNKQIAADLSLSEVTVKVHRGQVMRKMEAATLADLIRLADQLSGREGGRNPSRC